MSSAVVHRSLAHTLSQKGDKILLPPSAFDTLARLQVDYPMLFKLTAGNHVTHCGVLEFTAEEGCVYIPFWMMQNLHIEEGALLTVTNVSLPKATFVKLQPQSVEFLEISNPRAVLEHALRNFSCVTKGDIIQLPFNNRNLHFELKDVQPSPAACIIETDCNVDFDAPVGYQEPSPSPSVASSQPQSMKEELEEDPEEESGTRIVDGEIVRKEQQQSQAPAFQVADRVGGTGVQKNAAIPELAPAVDYWAVNAGDGARLDGKQPTTLKDAAGNEIDIRKLRAEAAARRAEANAVTVASSAGIALNGKAVVAEDESPKQAPSVKRKNRVGNKFSRLKQSGVAFQGSANSFK